MCGRAAADGPCAGVPDCRCQATAAASTTRVTARASTRTATASSSSRSSRRRCGAGAAAAPRSRHRPRRRRRTAGGGRADRRHPPPAYIPPGSNAADSGLGDEVVERPAVGGPGPQVGAGDLQVGDGDLHHPPALVVEAGGRPAPGRLTTTRVARRWISSWRSQVDSSRGHVPADDQEQLVAGPACVQLGQGVGGVRLPASVDLEPAGLQAGHAAYRRFHQSQPVLGRADGPRAGLLPGHVGHHQHDPVQCRGRRLALTAATR